ncbi:MAG: Gfo/Idh/MocA family oxidoreductase [Actinobacteria bacterium]|nr:Gfo/Idh/MocA family oxidoreductase [Actinomycetota bacterium]
MATQPLRAVIVGCRIGRQHAMGYTSSQRTELVAVCDIDPVARNAVGDRFDVERRYADFETMLRAEKPDLVSICTPQQFHGEMTVHAVAHRPKAILCEKAMAISVGEAEAMLAAADRAGVKLAIGHQGRWNIAYNKVRELILAGAIGQPLIFRMTGSKLPAGLMNTFSHGFSYICWMLGDPTPQWVLAQIQRESDRWERSWPAEELTAAMVGFEGGCRVVIECDIDGYGQLRGGTSVTGTDGVILLPRVTAQGNIPVSVLRADAKGWEDFPIPATDDTADQMRIREIDAFARWVAGDDAIFRGDAHLAVWTVHLLMGVYESARTRGLVRLPLKTKASPIAAGIASGEFPVRYPGRYDIRHIMTPA